MSILKCIVIASFVIFLAGCSSNGEVPVKRNNQTENSEQETAIKTENTQIQFTTEENTDIFEEITTEKLFQIETDAIPAETEVSEEKNEIQTETAENETTESVIIPKDNELVRITDYIPDAVIDLRYATENNFTGVRIYNDDEAYLCYGTVKKLITVQEQLKVLGYRILIWDAYRPVEAQQKLWEVYPDPTYVANPSKGITSHSRGNTIDISIVTLDNIPVEMPSEFDEFSAVADRDYSDVSENAAKNARMLEEIMTQNGFTGYRGEWWDYSDINDYYPIE